MNVLVTVSAKFAITKDCQLWTSSTSLGYDFWTRYLDVYDQVHLCVRVKLCQHPPDDWHLVTGPGIKSVPLPSFENGREFIKQYLVLKGIIRRAVAEADAIQLRLSCIIGNAVWSTLAPLRPYGIEVVGDPRDVFTFGSMRHPLRVFFRWWFPRQLRRQCAAACAVAYVTESTLQRRYPPHSGALSTHFSSIDLPHSAFVSASRSRWHQARPFTLITVGTLAQLYKAPDVLIDAVAVAVHEGLDLRLVLVGDGSYRTELEARASALNVEERVSFKGLLSSSDAVRNELDQADLFVLPSRQEGLPRAMIEAMARALPCIGSTVGGIPELLQPEDMVPPGDVDALARKIHEVVTDPERMASMSARNLKKAREYEEEALRERRVTFYRFVREQTEAWLKSQRA